MPLFPTSPLRTVLAATALLLASGCAEQTELPALDLEDDETALEQNNEGPSPATLIELLEAKLLHTKQQQDALAAPLMSEVGTSPEDAQALHNQFDLSSGAFAPTDGEDSETNEGPISIEATPPEEESEDDTEQPGESVYEDDCMDEDMEGDVAVTIMDAPIEVKPEQLISADEFEVVVKKISKGSFGDLKLALFLAKSENDTMDTALQLTDTQVVAEPELETHARVELPDVLMPAGLIPGKYLFMVRVDEGSEASACVRDNNTALAAMNLL